MRCLRVSGARGSEQARQAQATPPAACSCEGLRFRFLGCRSRRRRGRSAAVGRRQAGDGWGMEGKQEIDACSSLYLLYVAGPPVCTSRNTCMQDPCIPHGSCIPQVPVYTSRTTCMQERLYLTNPSVQLGGTLQREVVVAQITRFRAPKLSAHNARRIVLPRFACSRGATVGWLDGGVRI